MSNNPSTTIFLFLLMAVAFYFLMIRPQRKRQRLQAETIASLVPGSRVMLSSGIYATLVEMRGADADVELAPGVVVTVVRQAVSQAAPMTEEEVLVETDAQPSDELDSRPLSAEDFSAENLRPEDFRDDADAHDFGAVQPRSASPYDSHAHSDDFAQDEADPTNETEPAGELDETTPSEDTARNDDDRRPEGN